MTEHKSEIIKEFESLVEGGADQIAESLIDIWVEDKKVDSSIEKFKGFLKDQEITEKDVVNELVKIAKNCIEKFLNIKAKEEESKISVKKTISIKKSEPEQKSATKRSGYNLFYNEQKDAILKELEEEFKAEFPGKEYIKNQALVQRRTSTKWKALSEEARNKYNAQADEINKRNGIETTGKGHSKKEPTTATTAWIMFQKEKFAELKEKGEKVEMTNVTKELSQEWKKMADKSHYENLADSFNKEHGLETKKGKKKAQNQAKAQANATAST